MRFKRIPPQINRLALLTVMIVGSYALAHTVLTPKSFGKYGWYRGAALDELTQRPLVFAGRKACEECHSDIVKVLGKAEHKGISCETCHGPSSGHADNPDLKTPAAHTGDCARCHTALPSRPAWLKQIDPPSHHSKNKCTECHVPHQPNEVP